MQRNVEIQQLTSETLRQLLEVAVQDATPAETMPPLPGAGPDWTEAHKSAFMEFFEPALAGLDGPRKTIIYAITVDGVIAGFIRLARTAQDGVAETGIWVARSWRGKGISKEALKALIAQAKAHGFTKVVADTSLENVAALGVLRSLGAELRVHAELHL